MHENRTKIYKMENQMNNNASYNRRSSRFNANFIRHNWKFVLLIGFLMHAIDICNGHGRLIEPPSRSSAFRYGFQTPPNYNDHELYCGGFARQQKNGGKCGVCGDAFDMPSPRPNEYGGKYGQGVIVRSYAPGQDFTIRVELTASHQGYFEFRLCDNVYAKEECLDKNVLEILGGTPSTAQPNDLHTRFYPRNGSRIYEIRAKLPKGMECGNCVLQWRYVAGNNWGMCEDGTGAVGCGPQEEFRACADITIGDKAASPPIRPVRPGTKTTPSRGRITDGTKTTPYPDTEVETIEEPVYDSTSRYLSAIVIILSALLVVLCLLAAIYLYHYHGNRVKQFMHWNQHHQKTIPNNMSSNGKPVNIVSPTTPTYPPPAFDAPVPPPRTKRLSQTMNELNSYESNMVNGCTR